MNLTVVTLFLSLLSVPAIPADEPFRNPDRTPRTFGSGGTPLRYVVMGDSTAAGQGADYERGIAVGTATHLATRGAVTMTNMGISGAKVADVVADQIAPAVASKPDVVLLSVTANDVIRLTPVRSMERGLRTIIGSLREANPSVMIVVTGSPEMSSPPRIPFLLRPLAGWRTRSTNRMVQRLAQELRLTFAPIAEKTGKAFHDDHSLFAADHFHPNERGYALWVTVLNRALDEAMKK